MGQGDAADGGMVTETSTAVSAALELVGAVARLLNGSDSKAAISRVADLLRRGAPARQVTIWVRQPSGAAFTPFISPAPAEPPFALPTLEALPPPDAGSLRLPLEHDGTMVGMLALEGIGPGAGRLAASIVADLLAPHVALIELSEDLAFEVAVRARQIEEQRRFTGLVIDSLPVGLYVVDREYRIQIWNRKRETGTQGVHRDEVVGRPVFEVLTRQSADQLKQEFDQIFESGQMSQMDIEVDDPAGGRFYRISKIPMRLGGDQISHVITIGEDVTEWYRIHRRIMQNEKLAAVGQLAAGIMHEINNPLATIGACAAAMEGRLDEVPESAQGQFREYINIIDKEVDRCTNIVDGLLDFSRPKGMEKSPVAVNTVIEDTFFLLKHHTRFKKLTVQRELAERLPQVLANSEQLVQVLMSLMLNALDAMETGNGRLTVRSAMGGHRGGEVVVEVQDTGVGIPRSEQSKIFEPFYTTKTQGRGTGLGLSICYGIVEDHNGRLEVESQPGLGATFRVCLPALP
jgi:two-component system NtrC family sensor kinase